MTTETQIREILANPYDHEWSIQGFGMLRTWIDPEGIERLHIWNTDTANPDVSTIHDHPWDFSSRIVAGEMTNQRYTLSDSSGREYQGAHIRTGQGGGLIGHPFDTLISESDRETCLPGGLYCQDASEFHESFPVRGTVTVISRNFRHNRIATVCWPSGQQWITAEPRAATREEIDYFIALAK